MTIKVVACKSAHSVDRHLRDRGRRRGFGACLLGVVLAGSAWWSEIAMPQERSREYRLEYRLEAAGIATAESAKVKFTLTNRSPDSVRISVHNTPLSGAIETRMFAIQCNDEKEPLRFQGLMKSSAAPEAAAGAARKIQGSEALRDAVLINPGESRAAMVDLATAYGLPKTGTCRVAFTSLINIVEMDGALGQTKYDFTRAAGEPLVLQVTASDK